MKIKEVSSKAEKLIEVGKEVEAKRNRAMSNVQSAHQRIASAQYELDRASETDENGETVGDVGAAQADLDAAYMDLEYYEEELEAAEAELESINAEKYETIHTLDEYNEGESGNLSIIKQLQSKTFGGNVAAMAAAIIGQMNLAESTKSDLYKSMGMSYNGKSASSGARDNSVGGMIAGTISNLTSPDVKHWNGKLEQLSSKLQQIYTSKYSRFISKEKLQQPLKKTVRYETKKMFAARGLPNGVLGYNNGQTSHVAVNTGHELQTTVHENLHQLSANGNKRGIITKNGFVRENVQLNEAITELLTKRTLGDAYGADYSLYSGNRDAMALIENVMGEDVVSEAYFQNKPELMKSRFESVMGEGSWQQLSEAFDDSVSDLPHTRTSGIVRRDDLVNRYVMKSTNTSNGGNVSWREML